MDVEQPTLGEHLRARRTEMKLSLRQVERDSGINSGYLSQLERNEIAKPTPSVLQKVAKAYGIPFQIVMRWAGYVEDGLSLNAQRALSVLGDEFTDQELEALKAVLDVLRAKGAATFSSTHRTDLVLEDPELAEIRRHAMALLREVGDHRGTGAVDLDDVTAHAKLVRAGTVELSVDERRGLRARFGDLADWAISSIQGVVHFGSREVYVKPDMYVLKQNFVLAHEIGHWVLPDHRISYAALDDQQRLTPEFRDHLERQANQFGIELLSRGDRLREEWDDHAPGSSALGELSTKYAISLQAVARRVAEESRRPLAIAISHKSGANGSLRTPRVFCSTTWDERMGWKTIGPPTPALFAQLRAATSTGPLDTMPCDDLAGRTTNLNLDALDTAWARFLICSLPVPKRGMWGRDS